VVQRIADAQSQALAAARADERIPAALLERIAEQWALGQAHTRLV
jgi:hypothetical protein